MYLPTSYDSGNATSSDISSTFSFGGSSRLKNGDWSSLIGVVTAIVGNILISFALNTQRYAHMRLSRDREERLQEKKRAARRKHTSSTSYGTQQSAIAEDRAKQNSKAEQNGYSVEQPDEEDGETAPLIPRIEDSRKASGSSNGSANQEDKDEESPKEKSYLKSPIWWLGITMMVLGEIGNFLAYGFAPASIVSPLGVVALISNCIIAPLLLGEHFRYRDGFGVVVAIAGCVVVVLSASASNPKLTPDAIWGLVTTWEFETYLGITCFLIVVLLFLSNKYGQKTILIDLGLVALFGGYTALSTKGVSSLLTYSIWRVVTFPITYLLVAVLALTAIMQIKYVNRALQRFNATQVIPTQFVLFTISVILGSAVLYRDFESEKAEDGIKFVAGCGLTFFGVYCITSGHRPGEEKDDDTNIGEEEDAINLVNDQGATETREIDAQRQSSFAVASSAGGSLRRNNTAGAASLPRSLNTPNMQSALGTSPTAPLDSNAKPIKDQFEDIAPANTSAVHTDSSAPLYAESTGDPWKKPTIHATTSEPVVPTTPNPALRPKTPLNRAPTGPAGGSPSHRSPTRAQQQQLDPSASARKLTARHSVVGMFPGPLTSPLSGSLSAIVADELRRGVDKSPSGSLSRRRKTPTPATTRRPTELQQALNRPPTSSRLKRHSIASGELDLTSDDDAAMRAAAGSPEDRSGRVRSLSATLTDMFGAQGSNVAVRNGRKTRVPNAQEERRQRTLQAAFDENEAAASSSRREEEE